MRRMLAVTCAVLAVQGCKSQKVIAVETERARDTWSTHALHRGSGSRVWVMRRPERYFSTRYESLKANFDEDPFTEGLLWSKDDLLFADPTSKEDVTLYKDGNACDALELSEGLPAPVRERCRQLKAPVVAVDAGAVKFPTPRRYR
jgi:hypothetical protein